MQALSPLRSVNWHITDVCNFRCRYCFATFAQMPAGSAISVNDGYRVIERLREWGAEKLTFVGGEPLLHPHVSQWAQHAQSLGLTTMLVTNGSLLLSNPDHPILSHLDWCGLSIDSPSGEIQQRLGRRISNPIAHARGIADIVRRRGIRLKVNTVVTSINVSDDMEPLIREVLPERWKLFQYLPVEGERIDPALIVSNEEFAAYVARHASAMPEVSIASEDNQQMTGSYAMMDPRARFFDTRRRADGSLFRTYTQTVLRAGLAEILSNLNFAFEKLEARGGLYAWAK